MIKLNWTDFNEQKVLVIVIRYEDDCQIEEILQNLNNKIDELNEK